MNHMNDNACQVTLTPAHESESGCYTTSDIAQILGISLKVVYHLLKRDEFRVIRLPGGVYRIPKQSFNKWLNEMN